MNTEQAKQRTARIAKGYPEDLLALVEKDPTAYVENGEIMNHLVRNIGGKAYLIASPPVVRFMEFLELDFITDKNKKIIQFTCRECDHSWQMGEWPNIHWSDFCCHECDNDPLTWIRELLK